jgi:hypothetical protein
VYTTRNTDYHVFDGLCVAVRDRKGGSWLDPHVALARRLEGAARLFPNGAAVATEEPPRVGNAMFFDSGDDAMPGQVVTSRVESVGRPNTDELRRYPAA